MENFSKTGNGSVNGCSVVSVGSLCCNLSTFSDLRLYELCRTYGKNALLWRQKFLGLLPEVFKRKLYQKHGFSSIFEFGFKLAGVSEKQIRRVLNLEERFRDKRVLHGLLVSGKISVNKLIKIAPIATVENQNVLARQVKILPCKTLETLARDERNLKNDLVKSNLQNAHVSTQPQQTGLFGNSGEQLRFSDEVKKRLLELQRKGININELLAEFLDRREIELKEKKDRIAEELRKDGNSQQDTQPISKTALSRHIPAKVKKIIQEEHGTKCAMHNCNKPSEHLHHALPFALSQNHDPHYLIPLCKDHHIIAHSINQKFQEMRQVAVA